MNMTNKERIINCAVGESIDRSPFFFYFGPWGETVAAWAKQGVTNPDAWHAGFGFDPGVCMLSGFVNHLFLPGFTPRVISQSGDRVVSLNYQGEIVESGTTEEIFANPTNDYTKKLLAATPVPDPRRRRIR